MDLATYIVRIYRSKKGKPRGLVGVVEQVGVKGRRAFPEFIAICYNHRRNWQMRWHTGQE